MIDREKAIRQTSPINLPVRTILCVLICYVIFHHVVYFHFDGRSLTDHSFFFTRFYGMIAEAPAEGLWSFTIQVAGLWKQTMYPLVNALLAAASYIFGPSLALYRLFNLPFYILLILGSYALGRRMAGKNAGLACAFAVATLPIFDNFSRKYFPHFHSAAFLVWAFVLVLDLQAGGWKYWRGVLLGCLSGLSWLTHPISILMSVPILAFLVFRMGLFFRKDRQKLPALFCVPLLALSTAAIIYAPMVARFGEYYRDKKNYIVPDAANSLTRAWLDRMGAWCGEIVQFHLGWAYTAAVCIGLGCVFIAIVLSRRKPFPLVFLTVSVVFQLSFGLWIRANKGLSSDIIAVYALLPPVIAGGIYLLYHRDWFSRWWRGAIVAGTVLCLLWGVVAKGRTLSMTDMNINPSTYAYNSHRFIFPERDLARCIIENMVENTRYRSAPLTIGFVTFGDDQKPMAEEKLTWLWGYMFMYAALYDYQILFATNNRHATESYELFYLPMKRTEKGSVNRLDIRRMIKAYHQQDQNTKSTWFLSTHPYNFPFNDPFVDCDKPETLAVLIKHIGPSIK